VTAHVIAYLYRRPDLERAAFRRHYETRHARLAQTLLPPFSHYVRNHVIGSAGALTPPDCLSEFGYASVARRRETAEILGSERALALREDELRFMDKARNRALAVGRWDWPGAPAKNCVEKSTKTKYILWLEGGAQNAPQSRLASTLPWIEAMDRDLASVTFCAAEENPANDPLSCWLCRSDARIEPEQLWRRYKDNKLPLLCCATVDEVVGYPPVSAG